MWDNTGLECLINLSTLQQEHEQWEKDTMWRTLKGDPLRNIEPPGVPLDAMMMREELITIVIMKYICLIQKFLKVILKTCLKLARK